MRKGAMMLRKQKELVREALERFPDLRDNDNALLATIYLTKIGYQKIFTMTAIDLISMIESGKLPSFESVRRSRQKLQETIPKLRGKEYEKRHKFYQPFVKDELKNF